jgi:hypothetical protein
MVRFRYARHGTKSKPIPGPHMIYGFPTTALNAIVEKAMRVTLTTNKDRDVWMPAQDGGLRRCIGLCPTIFWQIVARGADKGDRAAVA